MEESRQTQGTVSAKLQRPGQNQENGSTKYGPVICYYFIVKICRENTRKIQVILLFEMSIETMVNNKLQMGQGSQYISMKYLFRNEIL